MNSNAFSEIESSGGGSLLSVVTSVVGMLVILATITGQRARQAKSIPDEAPLATSLELARQTATTLERELYEAIGQVRSVVGERSARARERDQLSTALVAAEQELAARRAALDENEREKYDLSRALTLAKNDLEKLRQQRLQETVIDEPSTTIESYPAPISKTVEGREAHCQIRAGHIAVIPLEELLDRFQSTAREKIYKLRDAADLTDTVGPLGGFNLRYTLVREDIAADPVARTRGGTMVMLERWELLPVKSDLGETLSEAMGRTSLFRAKLDTLNARDSTVTCWIYPDSFSEFREIRKELYQLGFHVAARPLPDGIPIAGSPHGSKSSAE